MSFRGRGRGRGRGGFQGGGYGAAKQVSWELFPEIDELGNADGVVDRLQLVRYYTKLQSYWKASPYYYEGTSDASTRAQKAEVERYSEMIMKKTKPKPPLSDFIKMEPEYVPAELATGGKKDKRGTKRVRWNPESDMQKLDLFEKLEKYQEKKEKKGDEGDEEEEERVEEEEEYSSGGDYEQNIDFDDDEDDYNPEDEVDDGPIM